MTQKQNIAIQQEITLLNEEDLFLIMKHANAKFDYPVHFHPDYELNLVFTPNGGQRIVGDNVEEFPKIDMVLIGSNLPHAWEAEDNEENLVYNLKFHSNLFDANILNCKILQPIKEMLLKANRGILYDQNIAISITQKMNALYSKSGMSSVYDFLDILYELAAAQNQRTLASASYNIEDITRESKSRRISKICQYVEENYQKQITLTEIGELVNMSESAVSHFFKKRTSRTFVTYLNDLRIGKASKMLTETTESISEIAYQCGFINMPYFNQTFKKYKNMTPSQYRSTMYNSIIKF